MPTLFALPHARTLLLLVLLALAPTILHGQNPSPPAPMLSPPPARAASQGTFEDRTGGKHAWRVNDANALLWNDTPYLPVGVTFEARSLTPKFDEAAWDQDQRTLQTLKQSGVQDIVVHPAASLVDVPVAAIQRLLDYLEEAKFRYGLAFGAGLNAPLSGLMVHPAAYRHDDPDTPTATWRVPHTDAALFLLVETANNSIIGGNRSGVIGIQDGVAIASTEAPASTGRVVGYLFPHKILPPEPGGLPDLWGGYDTYRDRLVALLSGLKFGSGLRFFLDPLASGLGLNGEVDYLVPDSAAFRLEWEGYLSRRYASTDEIRQNWKLVEDSFKSRADLARLVPLWANQGLPNFYDANQGKFFGVSEWRESQWWTDFLAFRSESIQYYMNAMASVLKRNVADVPVVYSWTGTQPFFLQREREGGFDGLAVTTRPGERGTLARTLAPAYSYAEQSARSLWCIASRMNETDPLTTAPVSGPAGSPAPVATEASRETLFAAMGEARRAGYKGLFVAAATTENGLGRVRAYAEQVATEANAATYAPRTLFFPLDAPGPARTGFVPGEENMLWLGAATYGESLDWWPAFSGYSIPQANNTRIAVVVSLAGPRKAHFTLRAPKQVQVYRPGGDPVPFKVLKNNTIEVPLDERPTLIRTLEPLLAPREAALDVVMQAGVLLQQAQALRIPGIEQEKPTLDGVISGLRRLDYGGAYVLGRPVLGNLIYLTAPYIWLEGERPGDEGRAHNFGEVVRNSATTNGYYLRLNTPFAPPRYYGGVFGARYEFKVVKEGDYEVWVAGSVPGPDVSPLIWKVDNGQDQAAISTKPVGPLYQSDRMGWVRMGRVRLERGDHKLYLKVAEPAKASGRYTFALDATLLIPTDTEFVPNGPYPPLPIDLKAAEKYQRDLKLPKP